MLFYQVAPGLRGTLYRGKRQLWTPCVVRKDAECRWCGKPIPAKSEAWRPQTNSDNRMWRLHEHCMTIA